MTWRGIETAPRDGRYVYLVRYEPNRLDSLWYVSAARWCGGSKGYWQTEDWNDVEDPTHWFHAVMANQGLSGGEPPFLANGELPRPEAIGEPLDCPNCAALRAEVRRLTALADDHFRNARRLARMVASPALTTTNKERSHG